MDMDRTGMETIRHLIRSKSLNVSLAARAFFRNRHTMTRAPGPPGRSEATAEGLSIREHYCNFDSIDCTDLQLYGDDEQRVIESRAALCGGLPLQLAFHLFPLFRAN